LVLAYNSRASDYSQYTLAALTDELTRQLSSKNDCELYEDEDGTLSMYIFRPYLNQAEGLIYRINVYERPPEFVIWEEDIPENLQKALQDIGKFATKKVITEVVRRLYESVDYDYFHTNGLYSKTPWVISKK
jgi:hypothetical protein